MAAVGLGNTGGDVVERGGPYFVRDAQDLTPTSQPLDDYSRLVWVSRDGEWDCSP
jgi:phospholipid/cholesterol/gamma-HCH transport system substrate-binding protein